MLLCNSLSGKRLIVVMVVFLMNWTPIFAQHSFDQFFQRSDTLSKTKLITASTFVGTAYTGFSVGFYNAWYRDFPRGKFRLFNDWGEWEHMDKAGHVFSGYFQARLCYEGAKWTGMSESSSLWAGAAFSTLFQTTIEVMDGFSSQWGFSIPDIFSNTIGLGAFTTQQYYWGEQRILIKESAWPVRHDPDIFISSDDGTLSQSLSDRAQSLYGPSLGERLLKDYNAQTYWASVNVHKFLNDGNKWPAWLNIAVGYGAQNMYGGFENKWSFGSSQFDATSIERYHQFYLSLDADLSEIRSKYAFVNTLLSIGNLFKLPAPTLEVTSQGDFIFHFIYF